MVPLDDHGMVDPLEAHAQRAFELLGKADAVIANLLQDPTDQVARVQAQQWQREIDDLDSPQCAEARQMIDYGDVLVDEHSQLFTRDGEPIWVTQDGRHIPLTKLEGEHLVAIRSLLQEDEARHSTWIGYVDREIARRSRAS